MKHLFLFISLSFCLVQSVYTQSDLAKEHISTIEKFQALVQMDKILELSDMIRFPLRQSYPLPDISTKEEFIF